MKYQAPPGTRDILPSEFPLWKRITTTAEEVCDIYGYRPIMTPGFEDTEVFLRGFSWIVNPFDEGGVVIAPEMSLGAIVAGPFNVSERDLSTMIQRVMEAERSSVSEASTSAARMTRA